MSAVYVHADEPRDEGGVGCLVAAVLCAVSGGLVVAGAYYGLWWLAHRPAVFYARIAAVVGVVLALGAMAACLCRIEVVLSRRRPGASLHASKANDVEPLQTGGRLQACGMGRTARGPR